MATTKSFVWMTPTSEPSFSICPTASRAWAAFTVFPVGASAADETLSEILDGLVMQFQATNAKFVSDYNDARTIVDTSASHASLNQPTPAPTPKP
jgi:hypothetical protein